MARISRKIPRVLTIAGSDSGGGAGIQADLKTFAALGVHGMSAITAITAQNTLKVSAIQDIEPKIVKAQIKAVIDDIGLDSVKTGMLHTTKIVEIVSEELEKIKVPVVVDPLMIAKSGASLLKNEALVALKERLIPLSTVVTPNAFEAKKLSGIEICSVDDAKKAAELISDLGVKAVVVKGGHISTADGAVDVLYYDGKFSIFKGEIFRVKSTHGTGCAFASAIAAELAKGRHIIESVEAAKLFVTYAIRFGLNLGKGHGPVNPMARLYNDAERYMVIRELKEAVRNLESHPEVSKLVPEVQTNMVMALPHALTSEDVAGIPGRIVKLDGGVKASSTPEFNASKHVSNTVLTAMIYDPTVRSGLNIRYSKAIADTCRKIGYSVSEYDRRKEPSEVKSIEGGTTRWGAEQAIKKFGGVPDVIGHEGDWGKEPVSTILGRSAIEVASKAIKIAVTMPKK